MYATTIARISATDGWNRVSKCSRERCGNGGNHLWWRSVHCSSRPRGERSLGISIGWFPTCRTVWGNGMGSSSVRRHRPLVIEYGASVVWRRISWRTNVHGQVWTFTDRTMTSLDEKQSIVLLTWLCFGRHWPSVSEKGVDDIRSNQIHIDQFSWWRRTKCHGVDRKQCTDRCDIDKLNQTFVLMSKG